MTTLPQPSPRLQGGQVDPNERKKWEQSIVFLLNKVGSATVTPGTINAQTVYTTTITVTGAAVGMDVIVTPFSTFTAGLTWSGSVTAANTVTLRIANPTAGNLAAAAGKWTARVFP